MITTRWFSGSDTLDDAYGVRRKVFIQEQNVREEIEIDGTDGRAVHLVVYDGNQAVATGRLLIEEQDFVLGRVAVLKEHRGKGYGDLIVRMLIRKACDLGAKVQHVHAQVGAKGFYEKLGFMVIGDKYMEAGMPHINMVHKGDVSGCGEKK